MRKIILIYLCTFALAVSAQTQRSDTSSVKSVKELDDRLRELAEQYQTTQPVFDLSQKQSIVEVFDGVPVFVNAFPSSEHERLGTFEWKQIPGDENDFLVIQSQTIREMKKKYPLANAIILRIKFEEPVTATAIKLK